MLKKGRKKLTDLTLSELIDQGYLTVSLRYSGAVKLWDILSATEVAEHATLTVEQYAELFLFDQRKDFKILAFHKLKRA